MLSNQNLLENFVYKLIQTFVVGYKQCCRCKCNDYWTGYDCSTEECPLNCNAPQGFCSFDRLDFIF